MCFTGTLLPKALASSVPCDLWICSLDYTTAQRGLCATPQMHMLSLYGHLPLADISQGEGEARGSRTPMLAPVPPHRAGGKQAEKAPFQEGIFKLVRETRSGKAPKIHPVKG